MVTTTRRVRRFARATVLVLPLAFSLTTVPHPAQAAAAAKPFTTMVAPFTQELYGVAPTFLGGLAFAPDGSPLGANGSLFRMNQGATTVVHGSTIHTTTTLPSSVGLGLTNSADGGVYANTGSGVEKVDPATGAVLAGPFGLAGNFLGIALDPITHNLVYVSQRGISWVNPALTASGNISSAGRAGDGLYVDPSGQFIFIASSGIDIYNRDGTFVQNVPTVAGHHPDGMAFHSGASQFVVSNNTDGTISRYDFPSGDFTKIPTQSLIASGGFRGDLAGVGSDGCLYVTQDGTRYADGTITGDNSIVKICPGFLPPVPVPTALTPNPAVATILPGVTPYLKLSAFLRTKSGEPVVNEPVTFKAGTSALCTGTTDGNGLASCGDVTASLQSVLNQGYQAIFAGDLPYVASTTTGHNITLNGSKLL